MPVARQGDEVRGPAVSADDLQRVLAELAKVRGPADEVLWHVGQEGKKK